MEILPTSVQQFLRPVLAGLTLLILVAAGPDAQGQTDAPDPSPGDTSRIFRPGGGSGTESGTFVDSIYFDGEMVRLTVRISEDMRRDSVRLRAFLDSLETATSTVIAQNLALNPKEWQPTAADRYRREEELAIAQDRDWIYPKDVTRIPVMSAPIGAIATSLGLVEDVTPRIAYTLRSTGTVTVKVYTQSALPVVTLVDGVQKPGEYQMDWDFKDTNGRRVLPGSYFVEVIVDGNAIVLQKRIVVP